MRDALFASQAKFMLSTWDENKYRKNDYIDTVWKGCYKLNKEHFYHVGAKEENRNSMMEALLMNYDPATCPKRSYSNRKQLILENIAS